MEEAQDPQSFLEFEHSGWQESVDEYERRFAPLTRQTIPTILRALGPIEGARVLDVACGPGDLARALRSEGAEVTAVDFSLAMLDRARERSAGAAVTYVHDDAETLGQLDDGSFDAVTMNYGILHLGRPSRAVRAARRVLRPGGTFAFSCWQQPDRAQGFAVVLDAVAEVGAAAHDVPHGPNFFAFSDDETIVRTLVDAGFADVTIREVDQTWELDDPATLFSAFAEGTARTGGMIRRLTDDDRAAVRSVAERLAAARFAGTDDRLRVPMPAKVASATVA